MAFLPNDAMSLATFAVLAAVVFFMRRVRTLERKIAKHKRAAIAVRHADADLENRLRMKSADLVRLGDALEAEVLERKRMEENLRERVEEIEALMAVIPIPVFVSKDPRCQRITGNRPSYALLKLPPNTNISKTAPAEEFVAKYRVFRHGKELPPEELPMQYAAAHGASVRDGEFEYLFEDGSRKQVFGHATPLFTREGKVRGCIAAFFDITEVAGAARRWSEERLTAG
jgi:PAS domain-containing protein